MNNQDEAYRKFIAELQRLNPSPLTQTPVPPPEEPEGYDMLKNCPCCNHTAEYEKMGSMVYVKCPSCGLKTELMESEKECRQKWNMRHEEDKFDKEMAESQRVNAQVAERVQMLKKMVEQDVSAIGNLMLMNRKKLGAVPGESTLNVAFHFMKFAVDRFDATRFEEFKAFREKVRKDKIAAEKVIDSRGIQGANSGYGYSKPAPVDETPF